uniref:Uncharacterized protein n=1 Tax=Sinocyclocheilus anshuiensis TaxID=1608454 RepID=A0A671KVY5_9TELE
MCNIVYIYEAQVAQSVVHQHSPPQLGREEGFTSVLRMRRSVLLLLSSARHGGRKPQHSRPQLIFRCFICLTGKAVTHAHIYRCIHLFKTNQKKQQINTLFIYLLGLHREAEKQFRSALTHQEFVDTYLYLAKVYQRLDQPITALNVFKQGLDHFPAEVTLLTGIARIHEEMNNMISATEYYKEVLKQDNTHVEAIACIGSNNFYTDQPEIALRFYRRLLQMGVFNCQLYNNLGLCCVYAQQYDMTLSSFERALALVSSDEEQADIWYNLGHVAVGIGDLTLTYQCFKLALAFNNNHGEAYNNLAMLELRKGRIEQAKAFLQTAASLSPHMYEPHFNFAMLSDKVGDLQSSYMAAQKSEDAFPEHVDTQQILKNLRQHFATL